MPSIVEERIKRWKNKLIDLSKRNRLLNFKATKVSTIQVVDEIPSEIYRHLVIEENSMQFLPLPTNENDNQEMSVNEEEESSPEEFRTYDTSELTSEHTDSFLRTKLKEKDLDKSLFRTYSVSNSVMEEQGYNALFLALGMVEWYEAKESDIKLKAPILLIPVELSRKSVKSKYAIKYASEEAPFLNPALVQKLSLDFGVHVETITEDLDSIDPQSIFKKIQDSIKELPRWKVTNEVFLSLFSFNKFIMYKDIESNSKTLVNNDVIKALCGIQQANRVSLDTICPEDELEEKIRPSSTFQVLDADSSQQRAILAVKSGHHLIIEGPPGTGKSQTISNIIAESLIAGKKVLFVSQKMAALDVVKRRLEKTGLGDFCLELHSRKSNKKRVIDELNKVMQESKRPDHSHDEDLAKLEITIRNLTGYVKDLHTSFGKLGITPFIAMGRISAISEIQDLNFLFQDTKDWDKNKFDRCLDCLDKLSQILQELNEPKLHSWWGTELCDLDYALKLNFLKAVDDVITEKEKIILITNKLRKICFYPKIDSLNDIDLLLKFAGLLLTDSPPEGRILENTKWNFLSPDIKDLIETVKEFNSLKTTIEKDYNIKILAEDVETILGRYQGYSKTTFLFFFNPQFWQDRNIVTKNLLVNHLNLPFNKTIAELEIIGKAKERALKIDSGLEIGKEMFGELWQGRESDGRKLEDFANWIVSFRSFVSQKKFSNEIFQIGKIQSIDKTGLTVLIDDLRINLVKFREVIEIYLTITKFNQTAVFGSKYDVVPLDELENKIIGMRDSVDTIESWLYYQRCLRECGELQLHGFIEAIRKRNILFAHYSKAFKFQFLKCWLDKAISERPFLRNFNGNSHEQLIETFKELDRKQIELAKIRIQHQLSGNYQKSMESSGGSERALLEREVRKKRAHLPLRLLFRETSNLLLSLKPCLMTSPLTVAQFIPPDLFKFDLIIFDEASQVPPEDSIGAIMRGNQIVIAGDTKQLPPTSFFQSTVLVSEDSENEDFEDYVMDDLESVLDECAASGFPKTTLNWHYRSRHESLIAFSNRYYYDYKLHTFPSADDESKSLGLKFNYLPSAVYLGGGVNEDEAKEVAKRIMKHFKDYPNQSLGVGTFSMRQRNAIENALEELRKADDSLEEFFVSDKPDHFFIKNLEIIQGDERDVIFLSVGYGKDQSGRLIMNFGPVNQLGGERRLNVLVTRARLRLEIFSSIRGIDLDLSKTDSQGVHLFKKYLDYAELGKKVLFQDIEFSTIKSMSESPFEESVFECLERRGVKAHKQVGCSGYRIDMAIVDANYPGRYILGIECDGAAYHSSKTSRDRDRLRQQVLEELDWNIYRIWSTDWYKNPKQEAEKLFQAIKLAQEGQFKKKVQNNIRFDIKFNYTPQNHQVPTSSIVISYQKTPITIIGSPKQFYFSTNKITDVFLKIVDFEGPIHVDEVRRRVIQHWGLSSVGSRIQRVLNYVEEQCVKNKKVERNGDFFWIKDKLERLKIRNREGAGLSKDMRFICPEEIEYAIKFILARDFSVLRDGLLRGVVEIFGIHRGKPESYSHVDSLVDALIADGKIIQKNDRLMIPLQ